MQAPTPQPSQPIDAALSYAEQGWPVFPCQPGNKHPYTPRGFHDASKDTATIIEWWERWPDAMIGMPTGTASGIVVLDCDVYKAEGREEYGKLSERVSATRMARSAKGGIHHYYKHPGQPVKNVAPIPGHQGIDMRGDGGYIILPGSVSVDGAYTWINEGTPIADLPSWILDDLNKKPVKATNVVDIATRKERPNSIIAEGGRNSFLTSYAGGLYRNGVKDDALLEALRIKNSLVCEPPLDDDDIVTICESAARNFDAPLPKTDSDNGEYLARFCAGRLAFVPEWGWLLYDGKRWEVDMGAIKARGLAESAIRDLYRQAADIDDSRDREALAEHATKSLSLSRLNAALEMAKGHMLASVEDFDENPYLLNCQNGTLNLETGELQPHSPADKLTKLVAVDYNERAESHVLAQFLEGITCGDGELAAFLQRAIGYSISGDTSEDKIFLCHGSGANGKSTFFETFLSILGEYGIALMPKMVEAETPLATKLQECARLPGKRYVLVPEITDGRLDTELLKALSGGDTITGKKLYHEPFNFVPQGKYWMTANQRPNVTEVTEAIWRRLLLVPFMAAFLENDPSTDTDMPKKLAADAPAVLAWAVQGFQLWRRQGLKPPKSVLEATEEYRQHEDPDGEFFEDCTEAGPDYRVERGELVQAYKEWARSIGDYERSALSNEAIYTMCERHGYRQRKSNGKRYILGLRVTAKASEAEEYPF
jgi:putative DNA primase/helicase